jgi:hypothetical protein
MYGWIFRNTQSPMDNTCSMHFLSATNFMDVTLVAAVATGERISMVFEPFIQVRNNAGGRIHDAKALGRVPIEH